MTPTSGGIDSPGTYSIACADGPSASATLRAREVSRSANRIVAKPGVSTSWRAARAPTSPVPTTSATVMAASPELGPVEFAPATLGRRELTFTSHAGDRTDRAGHPEHEKDPPKHLHGGQCK